MLWTVHLSTRAQSGRRSLRFAEGPRVSYPPRVAGSPAKPKPDGQPPFQVIIRLAGKKEKNGVHSLVRGNPQKMRLRDDALPGHAVEEPERTEYSPRSCLSRGIPFRSLSD